MKQDTHFSTVTNLSLKWIKDAYVNLETIKPMKEKHRRNASEVWDEHGLLGKMQKAQETKVQIDKWIISN
jgi:hypothetical protein